MCNGCRIYGGGLVQCGFVKECTQRNHKVLTVLKIDVDIGSLDKTSIMGKNTGLTLGPR